MIFLKWFFKNAILKYILEFIQPKNINMSFFGEFTRSVLFCRKRRMPISHMEIGITSAIFSISIFVFFAWFFVARITVHSNSLGLRIFSLNCFDTIIPRILFHGIRHQWNQSNRYISSTKFQSLLTFYWERIKLDYSAESSPSIFAQKCFLARHFVGSSNRIFSNTRTIRTPLY